MLIDNHVHVGWYLDGYHSPKEVWTELQQANIEQACVSSTSTCAEKYKLVVKEMAELSRLSDGRCHPILWLTPKMMRCWGIRYMLHSKIEWHGVKIHPDSHHEWAFNRLLAREAVNIARRLKVPMLIHTGGESHSEADAFRYLIEENEDVTFVLAHGRPTDQCINILNKQQNVYIDTAFMPMERIKAFADAGHEEWILWGTDFPVNEYYRPEQPTEQFVSESLDNLRQAVGTDSFERITSRCPYTAAK